MPDLEIHRTGDRFVINAEADTFNVLLSLARQMHRPDREPGQGPHWLAGLAETLSRVSAQLPSRPSYPNMETAIGELDIPGVDFVSYTARVVLGVGRSVL